MKAHSVFSKKLETPFYCSERRGLDRIIISGASGFIGRRLALKVKDSFPSSTHQCLTGTSDDDFCTTGRALLKQNGINPVPVELISGSGLHQLISPTVVFHLAANTHTWERDQRCNDLGTRQLIEAIPSLNKDCHVVFTSTVAVLDNRRRIENPIFSSTQPDLLPVSSYGMSKLNAEQYLINMAKELRFRLSICRLCTVYGLSPRPNTFFDVLKKDVVKRGFASRLNWPGLTSFIHVDDAVDCLIKIATSPPLPGEPRITVLATESRTVRYVSEKLHDAAQIKFQRINLSKPFWRILSMNRHFCRLFLPVLPSSTFNILWRFSLAVDPIFHCDSTDTVLLLGKAPRRISDFILRVWDN